MTRVFPAKWPWNRRRALALFLALAAALALGLGLWERPAEEKKLPVPPKETASPHALTRARDGDFPGFNDDMDRDSLRLAISRSLDYLGRLSPEKTYGFGNDRVSVRRLMASLRTLDALLLKGLSAEELSRQVGELFIVYRSTGSDGKGSVLFTGYYEPLLMGSTTRKGGFRHPLYRPPKDKVVVDLGLFSDSLKGRSISGRWNGKAFVPYWGRKDIDRKGRLSGKGLEILWVDDPVDAFFLHIQGSGRVALPDGSQVRVNYAGQNGRPYRAVGSLLLREGQIPREEMSMQAIREWLRNNPKERDRIFAYNPSYVFFREAEDGPKGCAGTVLVPGRSIALDRRVFPTGALAFIRAQKARMGENGELAGFEDFSRFALAQDTGGAIKGPGRVDVFWGSGPYAEMAAGHMKSEGSLYFLVVKGGWSGVVSPGS